uniref:Putative secreted protein n=1 Tax=Rhipicephalus microplus TaxID=6941 RepID=A0A6G5A0B8_RHIMP
MYKMLLLLMFVTAFTFSLFFICVRFHVKPPVVLSANVSEVNSRLLASDQDRSSFYSFFCFIKEKTVLVAQK